MPLPPLHTLFEGGPWDQRTQLGRVANALSQPTDPDVGEQPGDPEIRIAACGGTYRRTRFKARREVYKWHPDGQPDPGGDGMSDDPWQRQPDESEKAYRAFRTYLAVPSGERSLSRVISDLTGTAESKATTGRRHGQIERWSAKHRWRARAAAFDGTVDEERNRALIAAAIHAAERQVAHVDALMKVLVMPILEVLRRRYERPEEYAAELADVTVAQLFGQATAVARAWPQLASAEQAAYQWQRDGVSYDAAEGAGNRDDMEEIPDEELPERYAHLLKVIEALEEVGGQLPPPPVRHREEDGDA